MIAQVGNGERRGLNPWRAGGWGIAACLLLLPLVAMLFTDEVNWTVGDFIFIGLLIGLVGLAFELTVRVSRNWSHRAGVAAALAASFLTVWVNGAVGMIGSEDNAYNLLFLGVIGVALLGTVVARFRPAGMALAMSVAAVAQVVLAVIGMSSDPLGGIFSAGFGGLWLLSAAFFWNAARDEAAAGDGG